MGLIKFVKKKGVRLSMKKRKEVILENDNIEGVSDMENNKDVRSNESGIQFHKVINGDTLGKIALNYYGNAMKYPLIFEANRLMLTDPNKLYSGQILRIPVLL